MISGPNYERSQEATIYVGNLDSKVNEGLLCELFTQCGQVLHVHIPRDKITSEHSNYGFVEFKSEEDADYAIRVMHLVKLFGKPIKVNKTGGQDKRTLEVGANIFVGGLDPDVDQKLLYQTFANFGPILASKVTRDQNGKSKGNGFISYQSFQAADAAIAAMNSQYFSGKQIRVQYALKKDSKTERHGSAAQRLLAANRPTGRVLNLFQSSKQPRVINFPQAILRQESSHTLSIISDSSAPQLPLPILPTKK